MDGGGTESNTKASVGGAGVPLPGSSSSEGDGATALRRDPPVGMEGWGTRDRCPLTCSRRRRARASIRCSASTRRFCALGILLRAGARCQERRAATSRASRSSTSSQATPDIMEPVWTQQLLPQEYHLLACQLYVGAPSHDRITEGQKPHMTLPGAGSKLLPPSPSTYLDLPGPSPRAPGNAEEEALAETRVRGGQACRWAGDQALTLPPHILLPHPTPPLIHPTRTLV